MTRCLWLLLLLFGTISAFSQNGSSTDTFIIIEEPATFPGGMEKFHEYLRENVVYPKEAKRLKTRGIVFVEFFIKEDGYVDKDSVRAVPLEIVKQDLSFNYNPEDLNDLPQSFKDEVIRVIRNCPRWNPGNRKGLPVRQKMVLPFAFRR